MTGLVPGPVAPDAPPSGTPAPGTVAFETLAFETPALDTLALEELDGGIAVLRMNRPGRMNTQTVAMFAEYGLAAHALRDVPLRALILTGAGDRAFCAGFDLDEIDVITRMGAGEFLNFQELASSGSA